MYFFIGIVAFLLCLLGILVALKFFPLWGLLDRPHNYGLKRDPIPYYGGTVIFFAFLVAVLIFVPLDKEVLGLVIGALIIMMTGFLDDLYSVSPFVRLFMQFVASVILVFSGVGILSMNLPFLGQLDFTGVMMYGIPVLGAVFTVIWVMTIVNVMNFLDGVSGLSSGVSFVAGMTLFFLSTNPALHENPASQQGVAAIALILAMVSLAFLIFDFPKPKILMGDSGSTFFGFVIASLAIFSGGKVATAFLVLGFPILDMIWVVLRRTFVEKKAFWKGDLKHLHHRLLDMKFSEQQVVIFYLLVTAVFGFAAIMLVSSQQKFFMLISVIVLMLILAASLIFVPKKR